MNLPDGIYILDDTHLFLKGEQVSTCTKLSIFCKSNEGYRPYFSPQKGFLNPFVCKGTRNIFYGQGFLRHAAIGPNKKTVRVFFPPTWKDETIIFLFNRKYFSHKIFEYLRQEKNTVYSFYFFIFSDLRQAIITLIGIG